MKRCDCCGGKLGLIVHRKWRLRFCKLACKNSYQLRRRRQIRHRSQRLDTATLMSASQGVLRRYQAIRERVGYGILQLNPMRNPFEACFAPAASFGRSSVFRSAHGYVPPVGWKLESLPQLPSPGSLSGLSIMSGMRNLLLPISGACASILRRASARIAEHSCQLLAPIVESSLSGGVIADQGIGSRLARDIRATPATYPSIDLPPRCCANPWTMVRNR
jgi:hypothetical protein